MEGRTIRERRRSLGLTQQALADLLDVDQGTVSRWERGVERPRPARVARLHDLIGRSDARHLARSLAMLRNDLLPATLLDARLVLTQGSGQAVRHYRERGRDFGSLLGMSFDAFADRSGMPEVTDYLAEADYRRGGAFVFRFSVNNRGRGHTTIAEPLFDDGDFIGSFHYVTSYFEMPDRGGVSLERVDFISAVGDGGRVELMRGRDAGHIP